MFKLERHGILKPRVRLVAPETLDAAGFREIGRALGTAPVRARKTGLIAARRAQAPERIETRWNGRESEITAEPGDFVVTAMASASAALTDGEGRLNVYAVKPDRFAELYEATGATTEHGAVHRPKGVVEALFLSGGFEIKAPWGEMQQAPEGYLLLNGAEVYGNQREVFERTYEVVAS